MAYSLNGADFTVGQEQNYQPRHTVGGISHTVSPSLRMIQLQPPISVAHPDTEENVNAQTEEVFLNYVYQSYNDDSMREDTVDLPAVHSLLNFTTSPISPAAEIGRHLAKIGDELNEKYADMLDGMITSLGLPFDEDDTYTAFSNISRRVFANGINWGRVIILLAFGYRIAKKILRTQASRFVSFLGRIVTFMCKFLVSEHIASWIADHGGWRAALNYLPSTSTGAYLVTLLAAVSVVGLVVWNRYLK